LPCLRVKRVGSALPISKTFFKRSFLRHHTMLVGIAWAHRAPYGVRRRGSGIKDLQSRVVAQHRLLRRLGHSRKHS
jgi:hypothetical protein